MENAKNNQGGIIISNYYADKLKANMLFSVYDTKLPRAKQFLAAEIDFVKQQLTGTETVLEVGAGYGRIMKELCEKAATVTGIDISPDTVALGKAYLQECPNCDLMVMDAHQLEFAEPFHVVLCMQNGLSALKGSASHIIQQCLKVAAPGGTVYVSTYAQSFWEHRLEWFYEQAEKGLLGEIDAEKTKDGIIVCKDGFTATTFSEDALKKLGEESGCKFYIQEVDASSLFLVLEKPL